MKLVKHILFSLFLMSCGQSAIAQGLGLRAGYNFATVSGSELPDVGSNNGYYIGVYKEFNFIVKDMLYLVPELQYSKQGFSAAGSNVSLDYINVPILAKLYIVKLVSLETGPQFGFKIGDSGSSGYSYNAFDTAWAFGAAVNLPFRLSISGRYVGSFNEVVNGSGAKNQIFQLGLGFRL